MHSEPPSSFLGIFTLNYLKQILCASRLEWDSFSAPEVHGSDRLALVHNLSSEHIVIRTFVCESAIALCSLRPCDSVYIVTSCSMLVKDASHYTVLYMFYTIMPCSLLPWCINLSTCSQPTLHFVLRKHSHLVLQVSSSLFGAGLSNWI